jgi:YD repeat-containing protein
MSCPRVAAFARPAAWLLAMLAPVALATPSRSLGPFGQHASAELLTTAFAEPLVPVVTANLSETRALVARLESLRGASIERRLRALEDFARRQPRAAYTPSLLANLAALQRSSGYYSRALVNGERAFAGARQATTEAGQAVADMALGQLLELHAALGHAADVERLLRAADDRVMFGTAAEQVASARRALELMRREPGVAFRCGPLALEQVSRALWPAQPVDAAILAYPSTPTGTSLAEVADLAQRAKLPVQAVFRRRGDALPVPAIVHWKVGHFAAVTRAERDRYLIHDLTSRTEQWITRAALEHEASGYALVPSAQAHGLRRVAAAEAAGVRGQGVTGNPEPGATTPHHPKKPDCNKPSPRGMPVWDMHLAPVSLNLTDIPVGYDTPHGPDVFFELTYNSREASQPAIMIFGNLGPRWTHNWHSYVEDNPAQPGQTVRVIERGGGYFTYPASGYDAVTGRYTRNPAGVHDTLVRVSPYAYKRYYLDGSVENYTLNDAGATTRRVFLTSVQDPVGNAVSLQYDGSFRLTGITDSLGRATRVFYEDAGRPALITRVTDPFARSARLTYDTLGRLASITDTLGLVSTFAYGPYAGNPTAPADFIHAMTTPYGVTSFDMGDVPGQAGGSSWRWLQVTDPAGQRERIEFLHAADGIANSTTDPVPLGVLNQYLHYRNTFYWDRKAMLTFDPADADRYRQASVVFHWLHDGTGPSALAASVLESFQALGERRVWLLYPGQTSATMRGTLDEPMFSQRVLDDGRIATWRNDFDSNGQPRLSVDPAGRVLSYTYADNGVDLLSVSSTTAGTLARYEYDGRHLVTRAIDYAGKAATFTYNAWGQPLISTLRDGTVVERVYDTQGFLTTVRVPTTGYVSTFTWDTKGRLRTQAEPGQLQVTLDYDDLDRVVRESYEDGTYASYTFDRLDLVAMRDRSGRVTRYRHDAARRLESHTDNLGRTTRYEWCGCGNLQAIVDPSGYRVEWQTDASSRPVAKLINGRLVASSTYDSAGRLVRRTDALGQTTRYTYTLDDRLAAIDYDNAQSFTPPVRLVWDRALPRVLSLSDGQGLTLFGYHPAGVPGAGRLARQLGPKDGQVITFQYDDRGRRKAYAVDGVGAQHDLDGQGRLKSETTPLGTTTFQFDPLSLLPTSTLYPNGARTELTWRTGDAGLTLQRLYHRGPAGQTYADWRYTFAPGNEQLATISDVGVLTPVPDEASLADNVRIPGYVKTFGYDGVGQLVSVTDTDPTQPQVTRYAYDNSGNRTTEEQDGLLSVALHDADNQLVGLRSNLTRATAAALARARAEAAQRDGAQGGVQ